MRPSLRQSHFFLSGESHVVTTFRSFRLPARSSRSSSSSRLLVVRRHSGPRRRHVDQRQGHQAQRERPRRLGRRPVPGVQRRLLLREEREDPVGRHILVQLPAPGHVRRGIRSRVEEVRRRVLERREGVSKTRRRSPLGSSAVSGVNAKLAVGAHRPRTGGRARGPTCARGRRMPRSPPTATTTAGWTFDKSVLTSTDGTFPIGGLHRRVDARCEFNPPLEGPDCRPRARILAWTAAPSIP